MISTLQEITLHQFEIEKIELVQLLCKDLRILYLQNNVIGKIENLNRLKELRYLNLALNNIQVIENLHGCESLQKVDLTVNFVEDPLCLENLRSNIFLEEIYLTGNPCQNVEGYRFFAIHTLPQLRYLDGQEITKSERIQAAQQYEKIRERLVAARREKGLPDFPAYEEPEEDEELSITTEGAAEDGQRMTKHTPADRLKLYREIAAQKEESENAKMAHLKPKDPRPAEEVPRFKKDGTVLQKNENKLDFVWTERDDHVLLDVAVGRFLDTSLIDVDIQPTNVRITMKNKVLQLATPCEVSPDNSSVKRATSNGALTLIMPKSTADLSNLAGRQDKLLRRDNPFLEEEKAKNAEQMKAKEMVQEKKLQEAVDIRNILGKKEEAWIKKRDDKAAEVAAAKKKEASLQMKEPSPGFVDNPNVPPLE